MVAKAVLNDTQVTAICTGQNFTNIDNLQEWISPAWYSDYNALVVKTGMTLEQVTIFYSSVNSEYFGS